MKVSLHRRLITCKSKSAHFSWSPHWR